MNWGEAEQVLEAALKAEDTKDIQDTEMVMDGEKKGEKDKNYYDPEKYQYPDNQLGLTPSPSPKKEVAETETEDSVTTTEPETTPKPHREVSPEPSAPGSLESVDKEKEEDGKEKDLPMVTREAQQAFKEKGTRVSKSDAAAAAAPPAAPAKTSGKAVMKRPAAAKKGPEKPKSKRPKKIMAEPVEVVEEIASDDDQGDLASDLEDVASDQVETGSPGPVPNRRARIKAPSGTSQPKARATAKAKAAAKNVTTPKNKNKESRRASTKNHVPVEERANGVKEKKSGKKNDEEIGKKQKKTFAGRRCPECGPSLFRFRAMEKIYDEDVAPKLSISVGMAEERQLPTPSTPVWDHCFST